MAQSSDRVSRIAATRARTSTREIVAMVENYRTNPHGLELLAQDIRALCGSVLRQDETKGPRKGLVARILGR
jgi:hypothetical protein